MDLISIIVPVYNVERYLQRCVDSILRQTYKEIEVILVDDGSIDRSSAICDEYAASDPRIKVVHQQNGGASCARNTGIDLASGNYIGFVDSDDWIAPETYETLYKNIIHFDADVSDIDSIITSAEFVYKNEEEKILVLDKEDILIDYFIADRYSCCRKLYKRSVIGDIRFPLGKIGEDISTNFLFLSSADREVKSSLKLYYYYSNPESVSGCIFRKRDFDILDACSDLLKYSKGNPKVYDLAIIKQAVSYYSIIGRYISYECEVGYDPQKNITAIHRKLQQSYWLLMRSYIPRKKKFLVTICAIFSPHLLKRLYHLLKG